MSRYAFRQGPKGRWYLLPVETVEAFDEELHALRNIQTEGYNLSIARFLERYAEYQGLHPSRYLIDKPVPHFL